MGTGMDGFFLIPGATNLLDGMKIGVLSDTHGDVMLTLAALETFREQGVAHILHCGDIGTPEIVRLFSGIPTAFVFGNCDPRTETLRKTILSVQQTCCDWFGELELGGKRIFFLHGHQWDRFENEILCGQWDLICFGHTHHAELRMVENTLILNPGAIYRTPSPSVAIVDLESMNVTTISLKK